MFDFLLAAVLNLALMFVIFSCLSFLTIGITYAFAAFFKRFLHEGRSPELVLK